MNKAIYNYHHATGELLSEGVADESPLEPGVLLIAANATHIQPPTDSANEKAVFLAGAWSLVPDHRGQKYWLNGVEFEIAELGVVPPAGATPEKPADPPASLSTIKAALSGDIDDFISAIYSRFTRFGTEYIQREAAARAFKAGNYAGDAGVWVMAFATGAGLTGRQASDLILQQADQLRSALELLAAQRMRKYGINVAVDAAAAEALHDDIIAQASAIAAGL